MTALCLFAVGAADSLRGFTHAGLTPDGPARVLAAGGFDAVVAGVPDALFNAPDAKDRLSDVQWLTPIAQRHADVVRAAMGRATIMPVGFGSAFSGEAAIAAALRAHAGAIRAFLVNAGGCSEFSLRGWASRAEAIRRARASIEASTSPRRGDGAAYLMARRLDGEAERLAEDHALAVMDGVLDTLGDTVRDVAERPPVTTDAADTDRWQIAHVALLVPDAARAAFDARLDAIAPGVEAEGLTLELSGPWPPFSFCPRFDDACDRSSE